MKYINITNSNYKNLKDKTGKYKVTYVCGQVVYYKNDDLHKTNSPALIGADGSMYFYKKGRCHRTDGPAVILLDGTEEYYLKGIYLSKEDFLKALTDKQLKRFLINQKNFLTQGT